MEGTQDVVTPGQWIMSVWCILLHDGPDREQTCKEEARRPRKLDSTQGHSRELSERSDGRPPEWSRGIQDTRSTI